LIKKYGGYDDQLPRKYWGVEWFRSLVEFILLPVNLLERGGNDLLLRHSTWLRKVLIS